MAKEYIIVRLPCLPEDEGRTFFIKSVASEQEGKDWIAQQEGEYFGPGDYRVMT